MDLIRLAIKHGRKERTSNKPTPDLHRIHAVRVYDVRDRGTFPARDVCTQTESMEQMKLTAVTPASMFGRAFSIRLKSMAACGCLERHLLRDIGRSSHSNPRRVSVAQAESRPPKKLRLPPCHTL
jgi:hypothetical protein